MLVYDAVYEQVFFRLNMTTIKAATITIYLNTTVIMIMTMAMTVIMIMTMN